MNLLELQRQFARALMRPMTRADRISPRAAADFIKPNRRLSSRERLEIYSRSYWYRLIDSMYEDFPGLRAVVGQRAFDQLVRAYLAACPSRSYTLRDLGSQLETWLRANSKHAAGRAALALDMIRLEWAHIEAWDAESKKVLGPEDLLELGPKLRIRLQPFVRLLELDFPVDDLRLRVNSEEHETASNVVLKKTRRMVAAARLKPGRIYVAVYRLDFSIYYRRLTPEEFRLLAAMRDGRTVGEALTAGCKSSLLSVEELGGKLEKWFAKWAELGWFCGNDRLP
jgi:hypothetical protein